jgi:protein-S-isoprenylcysteine O-methyltransferase Ste14
MTSEVAQWIFRCSWSILLAITILWLLLYEDRPKDKAGIVANLIVAIPYLTVFGFYYTGRWIGTFEGNTLWHIMGTAIVLPGLTLNVYSHFLLRRNWSFMASIKKNHRLITAGPYGLIRHPMFASMLLIVPGSGFLVSNYLIIACTPIVWAIYYIRAKREEDLLRKEFPEYTQYISKTKMFIPRIF